MNEISYEEWKKRYISITIEPTLIEELKAYHVIDAVDEIERALKHEYAMFIAQGKEIS